MDIVTSQESGYPADFTIGPLYRVTTQAGLTIYVACLRTDALELNWSTERWIIAAWPEVDGHKGQVASVNADGVVLDRWHPQAVITDDMVQSAASHLAASGIGLEAFG